MGGNRLQKLLNNCFNLFVTDFSWLDIKNYFLEGLKKDYDYVFLRLNLSKQ